MGVEVNNFKSQMLVAVLLLVALLWAGLCFAYGILRVRKPLNQQSVMVVFGSGGHTTEMLLMLETINLLDYKHVHFVVAQTDTWSMTKIQSHFQNHMQHPVDLTQIPNLTIWRLRRAREVKQSYFTSVFTTIAALIHSFYVCALARPDLVVSNGPGTAVPLVLANILLSKILLRNTRTLFIESFCRVQSLSLSGKILLPFADKFIVHWPSLKVKHPSVIYFEHKII